MNKPDKSLFDIDREEVARYFYWFQLCFLLFNFGWELAKRRAHALEYWIERDTLRIDEGVWFLQRKALPLARITDINLTQGPFQRLFNIWTLQIHTAGRGTGIAEATLFGLRHPEAVRDHLLDAVEQADRQSVPQGGGAHE